MSILTRHVTRVTYCPYPDCSRSYVPAYTFHLQNRWWFLIGIMDSKKPKLKIAPFQCMQRNATWFKPLPIGLVQKQDSNLPAFSLCPKPGPEGGGFDLTWWSILWLRSWLFPLGPSGGEGSGPHLSGNTRLTFIWLPLKEPQNHFSLCYIMVNRRCGNLKTSIHTVGATEIRWWCDHQ